MDRPTRFEHHRWVGDKRNQLVHDLDRCTAPEVITELMESEAYQSFGPDTSVEARNRCYRRCKECEGVRVDDDAES